MEIVPPVFGTIGIVILNRVATIAAGFLFAAGQNRVSVQLSLGIIVVLIGGPAFGTLLVTRTNLVTHGSEWKPANINQLSVDALVGIPAGASVSKEQAQPNVESENGSDAASSSEAVSLHIEATEHRNVLVLRCSNSVLQAYLGLAVPESLGSAVPQVLHQAGARGAVFGVVGEAVPGLHALATAIAHLSRTMAIDSDAQETASSSDSAAPIPAEASAEVRPTWLDHPDEKQIVVQSQFEESQDLVQSQLAREMTRRLLEDAMDTVCGEPAVSMPELSRVSMTSNAVELSIEDRYSEEVILETADGPRRMFRTSALVQFTEAIERQAVRHVQWSVQHQRTWTIGATALGLGLVVMLAAGLLQMAGSSSRLIRWSGIPLVAVLMLLSVAVSSWLINRVVANENTQIPSPFEMPETVIGVETRSESSTD